MLDSLAAAVIGTVTYEEVMKYFIAHKNDDEGIVKGILKKENAAGGYTVLTQLFLDREDNIVRRKNGVPLGRRLKTSALDDEMRKAFKDEDYIVVT